MSYDIRLHPKVDKYLKKCEKQLSERIRKKLNLLKEAPFKYLEHYASEKVYKLRIGDYRALIDVDTNERKMFVRVLDHRNRIYKHK